MKKDLQLPAAIVVATVFACLTFLVYTGKLPAEAITGTLGAFLGWLLPSPLTPKAPPADAGGGS